MRYNHLRSSSWPSYDEYRKYGTSLQEIQHFEYQFKYPVNNIELLDDETFSQANQDFFVVACTQAKTNRTWLEFGAGDPITGSNTYFLEKNLNWSGISIELKTPTLTAQEIWNTRSQTTFIHMDALEFDLPKSQNRIDYLQIDINSPRQLELLSKTLDKQRFSVITYETDWFRLNAESLEQTTKSRQILKDHGYVMLVNGVTCYPNQGQTVKGRPIIFEDWWVDPQVVDKNIIDSYTWITEDSLEIKKYPTSILFQNDPHELAKYDNNPPLRNSEKENYYKCAGIDWPSYEKYMSGELQDIPDLIISEIQSFNFLRK
jgi:hypothetical protein